MKGIIDMITTNYNSENFNEKSSTRNDELIKLNKNNLAEVKSAKCNNCAHLNFGKRYCKHYNSTINSFYTAPTEKGTFISVLKPPYCDSFKKKNENSSVKTTKPDKKSKNSG